MGMLRAPGRLLQTVGKGDGPERVWDAAVPAGVGFVKRCAFNAMIPLIVKHGHPS